MKFIAGAPKGETIAKFVFEGDLDGIRDAAKANNFSGNAISRRSSELAPASRRARSSRLSRMRNSLSESSRAVSSKSRCVAVRPAMFCSSNR